MVPWLQHVSSLCTSAAFRTVFQQRPRHEDDEDGRQHDRRGGEALTEISAREHEVIDIFGGYFGGDAWAAIAEGDDEIVNLDDRGADDDECGGEYRPHHRDDDEKIGLPSRDAIDTRGLPYFLVDTAQSCQH